MQLAKITPLVSVVMSAYNASEYIAYAIESILNQTIDTFEFIIIDDGSTDNTLKIIKKYASEDSRIVVISRENKGLVTSLNEGIASANAEIIARQDADDISYSRRFQKQLEVLKSDSSAILVGSSMDTINENGEKLNQHKVLLSNPEIKQELLIRSPFPHGSVMFRKDAFIKAGGYKKEDWPAEDYGLWVRMAQFGIFTNIDEPLYKYRENSKGISAQNSEMQIRKTEKAREAAWEIRKQLLVQNNIDTIKYRKLPMGEYRIDRILDNTLFVLMKAFKHHDLRLSFACTSLIATDKILLRKIARRMLSRIKLIDA